MEGLRRRWLGLTVILDVGLRCFGCVNALRDDGGHAPNGHGVRPSRVCLLRGVWLLLCGAVLRVRNVLRPYDDDLLPALTYVLLP